MKADERLYCIKHINPLAHCVVWQDGDRQWVAWDEAHVEAKPTLQECEAVLPQVQKELKKRDALARNKEAAFHRLIEREMKA